MWLNNELPHICSGLKTLTIIFRDSVGCLGSYFGLDQLSWLDGLEPSFIICKAMIIRILNRMKKDIETIKKDQSEIKNAISEIYTGRNKQ